VVKKKLKTKKKTVAAKKQPKKKPAIKRKTKKVSAIPKGYQSITPYLIVNEGVKAIAFYKKVFGAKERMRMNQPGGKIGHAELKIGDSIIMLADECHEVEARSPKTIGGSPITIHVYIKNVDEVVKRAVKAGATLIRPIEDMFFGDRSGGVEDPFGHKWIISTHIEDVTPAQLKKRAAELFGIK
jgi:PhnB protein